MSLVFLSSSSSFFALANFPSPPSRFITALPVSFGLLYNNHYVSSYPLFFLCLISACLPFPALSHSLHLHSTSPVHIPLSSFIHSSFARSSNLHPLHAYLPIYLTLYPYEEPIEALISSCQDFYKVISIHVMMITFPPHDAIQLILSIRSHWS